jgi:hypothetical protein
MGAIVAEAVDGALNDTLGRARDGLGVPEGGIRLAILTREVELPFAYTPALEDIEAVESQAVAEIDRLREERARAAGHTQAGSSAAQAGFAGSHENPLLAAETFRDWATAMKRTCFDGNGAYAGPRGQRARFSFCKLGDDLVFFSIPGEAFCAIGKALKRLASPAAAIICGYCGGTVGYIPTEKAYAQGGYEVETAFRYYGQPAPLSPKTEGIIMSLFEDMLEEETRCRS